MFMFSDIPFANGSSGFIGFHLPEDTKESYDREKEYYEFHNGVPKTFLGLCSFAEKKVIKDSVTKKRRDVPQETRYFVGEYEGTSGGKYGYKMELVGGKVAIIKEADHSKNINRIKLAAYGDTLREDVVRESRLITENLYKGAKDINRPFTFLKIADAVSVKFGRGEKIREPIQIK